MASCATSFASSRSTFMFKSSASLRAPRVQGLRAQSVRGAMKVSAHTVTITTKDGKEHNVEVPEGEFILEYAIAAGLDVPYDCKMGVCMTCPSMVTSGEVEQGAGMLSDDVAAKGYALLCVAEPKGDVSMRIIEEDELLEEQLSA